jgi:hypothetical protein
VGLGIERWAPGTVASAGYIPGPGMAAIPISQTNETTRNGILRAAVRSIPNLSETFRRYNTIYRRLKPTLMHVGGMPAILSQKPDLVRMRRASSYVGNYARAGALACSEASVGRIITHARRQKISIHGSLVTDSNSCYHSSP